MRTDWIPGETTTGNGRGCSKVTHPRWPSLPDGKLFDRMFFDNVEPNYATIFFFDLSLVIIVILAAGTFRFMTPTAPNH
jgi:hypothetical protein